MSCTRHVLGLFGLSFYKIVYSLTPYIALSPIEMM
jgi:hypothetical protein